MELHVFELKPDTPIYRRIERAAEDANNQGREGPTSPRTLADWIEQFGGLEGEVTDPHGNTHAVSLQQWRNRDPDATYVGIAFKYRDPEKVGTKLPREVIERQIASE